MGDLTKILGGPIGGANPIGSTNFRTALTVPVNTTYVVNKIIVTNNGGVAFGVQGFEIFHEDTAGRRFPVYVSNVSVSNGNNPGFIFEQDVFVVMAAGDTLKYRVITNTQSYSDSATLIVYGVEQT